MNSTEKCQQLKQIIDSELRSLINHDYVLWGTPYYSNIGDILIWQGELDYLKSIPYHCLGTLPYNNLPNRYYAPRLSPETIILVQGGGYFGDVWRMPWTEMLDSLLKYRQHPIILLPQTIFYENEERRMDDYVKLSQLENLTICVRDRVSYAYAVRYFGETARVLLVPDMAFYISLPYLEQWKKSPGEKDLYLKRLDKEAIESSELESSLNIDVRDWPTLEPDFSNWKMNIHYRFFRLRNGMTRRYPVISRLTNPIADYELKYFFRPDMLRIGVEFVSSYRKIYTTRLHVLILSVLLGKEVVCEDNSYGKLSSFYDTWLRDLSTVDIKRREV